MSNTSVMLEITANSSEAAIAIGKEDGWTLDERYGAVYLGRDGKYVLRAQAEPAGRTERIKVWSDSKMSSCGGLTCNPEM